MVTETELAGFDLYVAFIDDVCQFGPVDVDDVDEPGLYAMLALSNVLYEVQTWCALNGFHIRCFFDITSDPKWCVGLVDATPWWERTAALDENNGVAIAKDKDLRIALMRAAILAARAAAKEKAHA